MNGLFREKTYGFTDKKINKGKPKKYVYDTIDSLDSLRVIECKPWYKNTRVLNTVMETYADHPVA